MEVRNNLSGGVILSARPYPIGASTAIKEGQLVKLSGGKVVLCTTSDTSAILGVAAESHTGTADALDPRANGTEIMVYDSPDQVLECPALALTATGGSATTVTATAIGCSADDFNGGFLQLIEKASASTNTDAVYALKEVTDYAEASSVSTFTVASGGTANNGDKYQIYPPIGFAKGAFDSNIRNVVKGANAFGLKCIGHDYERGKVRWAYKLHAMGSEE